MSQSASVHFSSEFQEWETPRDLFEKLDCEFGFTLDPCCHPHTAKCKKFFTPAEDGLSQPWHREVVFMNPPYGRAIGTWVKKAFEESTKGALVVGLIPARTDTSYWHEYVIGSGAEVRFLRGRVKFERNGERHEAAPFPSAVIVWRPDKE